MSMHPGVRYEAVSEDPPYRTMLIHTAIASCASKLWISIAQACRLPCMITPILTEQQQARHSFCPNMSVHARQVAINATCVRTNFERGYAS